VCPTKRVISDRRTQQSEVANDPVGALFVKQERWREMVLGGCNRRLAHSNELTLLEVELESDGQRTLVKQRQCGGDRRKVPGQKAIVKVEDGQVNLLASFLSQRLTSGSPCCTPLADWTLDFPNRRLLAFP
jgi:hypothetical protein